MAQLGLSSFVVFLFLWVLPSNLYAVEFYGVVTQSCDTYEGHIVTVDETQVRLYTDQGIKTLERKDIRGIMIYTFISSPLKGIGKGPSSLENLKLVVIKDEGVEKKIHAYPVQFIDDLVVFIDINGETHVHSTNTIFKLRPALKKNVPQIKLESKAMDLQARNYVQTCHKESKPKSSTVRPNRILIDQIRLHQFLSQLQESYSDLESFEEKTYVYARPLLFDYESRFGLALFNERAEESSLGNSLPVVEWSSGAPYSVQSHNQLGGVFNEFGEDLDMFAGVISQVKAHFFHAYFAGNFAGLSAGESFLISANSLTDTDQSVRLKQRAFDSASNYMALMGVDYGPYSLSGGFYYPVFLLLAQDEYREALSTNPAYLLRGMYTTERWQYSLVVGLKDENRDNPDQEQLLTYTNNGEVLGQVNSYGLDYLSLRLGVSYFDPIMKIRGHWSLLYMDGSYEELFGGTTASDISFSRWGTSLSVNQSFGDYVRLGLRAVYVTNDASGSLNNSPLDHSESHFITGGEFSIVF